MQMLNEHNKLDSLQANGSNIYTGYNIIEAGDLV